MNTSKQKVGKMTEFQRFSEAIGDTLLRVPRMSFQECEGHLVAAMNLLTRLSYDRNLGKINLRESNLIGKQTDKLRIAVEKRFGELQQSDSRDDSISDARWIDPEEYADAVSYYAALRDHGGSPLIFGAYELQP